MTEFLNCPDHEELAAWIDGQVDAPTRVRLEAHVADCDRCAAVVEEVLAFNEELELAEDGVGEGLFGGDRALTSESDQALDIASENAPDAGPVEQGLRPVVARARFKPYVAAAFLILVMAVGFRLIPHASPEDRLREGLLSLSNDPTYRGAQDPLTEKELPWASECRQFLRGADASGPVDILTDCLDLVARSPDLASQVVVEASGFSAWLGGPVPLGMSSCQVLGAAWQHLRRARQDELRPLHEVCLERLATAAPEG